MRGLQAAATPTPRAPPCPGARAGRGPRGARRPPAGPAPAASPVAAGRVRALAVPARERLGRCEGRPCAARGFPGGRLRPRLCLLPGRRPERLSLGERQSVAVVSGVARGEQRLGKVSDGTQAREGAPPSLPDCWAKPAFDIFRVPGRARSVLRLFAVGFLAFRIVSRFLCPVSIWYPCFQFPDRGGSGTHDAVLERNAQSTLGTFCLG